MDFFSSFRVVLIFLFLAVAACFVLPSLKVNRLPKAKTTSLFISYSLPASTPELIEQKVTSILENVFSQQSQLRNMVSTSKYNYGYIQLDFDRNADIAYHEFEVSELIRQIYPKLPEGTSYPSVSLSGIDDKNTPLLSYIIAAPLQTFSIKKNIEALFQKELSKIPEIQSLSYSSTDNLQLTILFDKDKCQLWNITPDAMTQNFNTYFNNNYPGTFVNKNGEQLFVVSPAAKPSISFIENILLKNVRGETFRLKDVAKVFFESKAPESFYHINGNNAISLAIYAQDGVNEINTAVKIKAKLKALTSLLPQGYTCTLNYDDAQVISDEIIKNYQRIALSVGALLLFVVVVYRSFKHAVCLFLTLIINVCLIILGAKLLNLNIHIYTIAGIAVALGFIIDNAIVMLDYYEQTRGLKVFLALLTSTCCIIAALCVVFFLPQQQKQILIDFAIVVIIALLSSLVTSLYFVPALVETLNLKTKPLLPYKKHFSQLRNHLIIRNIYASIISFIGKRKLTFILILVLIFGLPVYKLPPRWDAGWFQTNKWYHNAYNSIFDDEYYKKSIKPYLDEYLGGFSRLFVENIFEKSEYRNNAETKLYLMATMPPGHSAPQLMHVLSSFEKYLSRVQFIKQYITTVNDGEHGLIEISFKPAYMYTNAPIMLKSQLVNQVLDFDGVEWAVYGVGQGFSNNGPGQISPYQISLKGYNYDDLEKKAVALGNKLSEYKRIEKINTNDQLDYDDKPRKIFTLDISAQKILSYKINEAEILNNVSQLSKPLVPFSAVYFNNQYCPVVLREIYSNNYSDYQLLNQPIYLDSARVIKLNHFAKVSWQQTAGSIKKSNRQYERLVSFDYMGAPSFANKFIDTLLKQEKRKLPVGYSIEKPFNWNWPEEIDKSSILFGLLAALFLICALFFESLRSPFYIIISIPVSFLGIFSAFLIGDFYFDQGGYGSFILLEGLVTSASIYILYDLNQLLEKHPNLPYNKLLLKACIKRSRTIVLTSLSTCCGLVPFLLERQNEAFWFSLAVGTLGGMLFLFIAVFVVLPVLLYKKEDALPYYKSICYPC
jgi:multidrug efflux pump subunit AcrB